MGRIERIWGPPPIRTIEDSTVLSVLDPTMPPAIIYARVVEPTCIHDKIDMPYTEGRFLKVQVVESNYGRITRAQVGNSIGGLAIDCLATTTYLRRA